MRHRARQGKPAVVIAAAMLAIASLAYLAEKSLFSHDGESDFRFLWLAGRLWADGIDPYSDRYTALGRTMFPTGNEIAYWLYPPAWWPICRLLAAMPFAAAVAVWRTVSAAALIGGGALLAAGLARAGRPLGRVGTLLFLALLPAAAATPQVLAMGQTSMVVFLGLCCVGYALLAGGGVAMALGVALLLLKPQIGAVAVAAVAADRRWWPALAGAVAVSAIAALPQMAAFGGGATAAEFVRNLHRHASLAPNQPAALSGLTQAVWRLGGIGVGTSTAVALGMAFAAGTTAWTRGARRPERGVSELLTIVAAAAFFVPLHVYDFVALLTAAALLPAVSPATRVPLAMALALLIRPALMERLFLHDGDGGIVALTAAGMLAVTAALIEVVGLHTPTRHQNAGAS